MVESVVSQGIPSRATSIWQLDVETLNSDPDEAKKLGAWNRITRRGGPVVFINGRAKADPTVEEIVTAYQKINEE